MRLFPTTAEVQSVWSGPWNLSCIPYLEPSSDRHCDCEAYFDSEECWRDRLLSGGSQTWCSTIHLQHAAESYPADTLRVFFFMIHASTHLRRLQLWIVWKTPLCRLWWLYRCNERNELASRNLWWDALIDRSRNEMVKQALPDTDLVLERSYMSPLSTNQEGDIPVSSTPHTSPSSKSTSMPLMKRSCRMIMIYTVCSILTLCYSPFTSFSPFFFSKAAYSHLKKAWHNQSHTPTWLLCSRLPNLCYQPYWS